MGYIQKGQDGELYDTTISNSATPSPTTMKDMDDLRHFIHGQEGTHWACKLATDKANAWGLELECCACSNHKCQNPNPTKGEEQR